MIMTWDEKKWDEKTLKRLAELSEEVARDPIMRQSPEEIAEWLRKKANELTRKDEARSSELAHQDSDQSKRKRCPACNSEYSGSMVVCRHDGTLLIPVRGWQ